MFLGNMATPISISFKSCNQGRFTRTAGSNNTDKGCITWRLHKNFEVTTSLAPLGQVSRTRASVVVERLKSLLRFYLLIILHQSAELFRTAQHSKGIARVNWANICGMHFRLVIVPDQDDVEMIVVFHVFNSLIREARRCWNRQARKAKMLTFNRKRISHV